MGNHNIKPKPVKIVIFGAGGDLTQRKLMPALYNLYLDKLMPDNFSIIGVDIKDLDDDGVRKHIHEGIDEFSRRGKADKDTWAAFEPKLSYLKGDFTAALDAYREGIKASRVNDDMLVATSDWLYMTLRRLGRDAEAKTVLDPIREQMDVLENGAYHARLLMYKGLRTPDSVLNLNTADDVQMATQGYGVGNWYLVNGDRAKARTIFEKVLSSRAWAAFGFIAAEADVKRGM